MNLVSSGTCPLCAALLPGPHMRSCQHWGTSCNYCGSHSPGRSMCTRCEMTRDPKGWRVRNSDTEGLLRIIIENLDHLTTLLPNRNREYQAGVPNGPPTASQVHEDDIAAPYNAQEGP